MANITQPVTRLLFNEVLNADFGVFSSGGVKQFLIKKHGLQIPATNTTVKITETTTGKYKAAFVEFNKIPVVVGEPFEMGFSVVRHDNQPGVNNSTEYFPHQQYYGGKVLAARALVNGLVADADVLSIENQIFDIAKSHYQANIKDPAFVALRRAYIVTDDGNNDASGFTVTLENGTEVVYATGTTFAAGQLAVQFNALSTVNTKLYAVRIGADKYLITSIDPFYKFTIGTAVDTTIVSRSIFVENRSLDNKIEIKFDQNTMTVSSAYLTVLDGTTRTTTALKMYIDGTELTVAGSTTLATLVGQIVTAGSAKGIYAVSDKDSKIIIFAPGTANGFTVKLGDANTLVKLKESTPDGAFAVMTSDDIKRAFMHKPNNGNLSFLGVRNAPIDGGVYRKYIFTTDYDNNSLTQSAGGKIAVRMVVELYILKSQCLIDMFKEDSGRYMDETKPSGADVTFDELVTAFKA